MMGSYNPGNGLPKFILTMLIALLFATSVDAKTTNDPNHNGWTGKGKKIKPVDWKPVASKCPSCQKMVAQYNQTMVSLFDLRFSIQANAVDNEAFKKKLQNQNTSSGTGGVDASDMAKANFFMEYQELYNKRRAALKNYLQILEKQARYLQWALQECEKSACSKKQRTKIKELKVGGELTQDNFQPEIEQLFKTYDSQWEGPHTTKCKPCLSTVIQLNAVPGWLTREHLQLVQAEQERGLRALEQELDFHKGTPETDSEYARAIQAINTRIKSHKDEIKALMSLYKKLLNDLVVCEKKYCPAPKDSTDKEKKIGYIPGTELTDQAIAISDPYLTCPEIPADQIITVGSNADLGSSADFKEKAGEKIMGAATSAVMGLLGGGGGGGKSSGPVTYKDPVKKKYKLEIENKQLKRELRTGAVFTEDGLLVSTDIKKAPGKGTFQSVYLQNPRGWRLVPSYLYLYEIWKGWTLNVSWTKDTYVNGEHVKHEEGGWSESWKELIAKGEEIGYTEVYDAPIWEQMGFNTAVSGARSLGTLFPVSPAMLQSEPLNLVIHVTDPDKDPVVTHPYLFTLSLDNKGNIVIEEAEQSMARTGDACGPEPAPRPPAAPGTYAGHESVAVGSKPPEIDPKMTALLKDIEQEYGAANRNSMISLFENIIAKQDAADRHLKNSYKVEMENEVKDLRTEREELIKDEPLKSTERIKEIDELIEDLERKAHNIEKTSARYTQDAKTLIKLLDSLDPFARGYFERYKVLRGISTPPEVSEADEKTIIKEEKPVPVAPPQATKAKFNTLEEEVEKLMAAEKTASTPPEDNTVSYCGPDVTKGFMEALELIAERMKAVPGNNKGLFDGLIFMIDNGQSIDYFPHYDDWQGKNPNCPNNQCASSDPCYTLFGTCVPRHVLSDTMYGFAVGMVELGSVQAKAGGAYAEFNKKSNSGVSAAMESVWEDLFDNNSSTQKENPASVGAYKFGHTIAMAVRAGEIHGDTQASTPLSEVTPDQIKEYGDTLSTFDKYLKPTLSTAYAYLKDCKQCPDTTPLYTYGFKAGVFRKRKDWSRMDWPLDDEGGKKQVQIINDDFLFIDPFEFKGKDHSEKNLETEIRKYGVNLRPWELFYEQEDIDYENTD